MHAMPFDEDWCDDCEMYVWNCGCDEYEPYVDVIGETLEDDDYGEEFTRGSTCED